MNGNIIGKAGNTSCNYYTIKSNFRGDKGFSSALLNSIHKDSVEIIGASNGTTDDILDFGVKRILDDNDIKYLSEKYNVEDMTNDEQKKLLLELRDMGVISKEDYKNCIISYVYIEDNSKGLVRRLEDGEYAFMENLSSNLLEKLRYESSKYFEDYLYWQEMEKEIPRYQEISKSIYDVSEILALIVREKN